MSEKEGPDMENRDPNNLNDHVKVRFEDVFGEPDGAHSHPCVWLWAFKCFSGVLGLCYKILTFICALPLAFCWACTFACTAFCHIWYCTPYLREYQIQFGLVQKQYRICLDALVAPCCVTCGYCFSNIVVTNK